MARSSADRYLDTDFPNLSTIESDGRRSNGNVQVKSDKDTGNYTVSRKTDAGLTGIYSYDAPSNSFSIQDQDLYDSFFAGRDGNQQKIRLDSQIKGVTVDAAKKDIPDSSLAQYNDLSELYDGMLSQAGYLSYQNTGTFDAGLTPEDFGSTFSIPPESWTNISDPNFLAKDNNLDLYDDLDIKAFTDVGSPSNPSSSTKARAIDFQKGASFVYPETMPDIGYDFIKFTSFKYVPAGLSRSRSAKERIFTDKITEIILPMLPNISESNAVDWGGDKINAFQLAASQIAMSTISDLGNGDLAGALNELATGTRDAAQRMMADPGLKSAIAAYFAGQAVSANILTRSTGMVLNPNLELLFNGPTLRTFNFNFRLTPRSRTESLIIKNMIKSFKRNMAAQRSESDLFLLTPNVYKIEYIYGGTTPPSQQGGHPYMNKIKPCALRSFNVNYGPDGAYMTYPDGSMTCYEIQLQFGELEPIYADEIKQDDDNMSY